jgi:hypothetical protein
MGYQRWSFSGEHAGIRQARQSQYPFMAGAADRPVLLINFADVFN